MIPFGFLTGTLASILLKGHNKALTVGMQILNAIDGAIEESTEGCGDEGEFKLFPIYIKRGGKRWTISVSVKCEKN